jgi:phage-related protein
VVTKDPEWTIVFYRVARGTSPPLEFINGLPVEERAKVYNCLRLLHEFGTRITTPHAKPVSGHKPLWELRPGANRLLYVAHTGRRFIVLHAFPKPRRKIPARELATAERRWADFLERER